MNPLFACTRPRRSEFSNRLSSVPSMPATDKLAIYKSRFFDANVRPSTWAITLALAPFLRDKPQPSSRLNSLASTPQLLRKDATAAVPFSHEPGDFEASA